GLVEVSKMPEIDSQQIRETNPAAYRQNRTGQSCEKALLYIRGDEVEGFDGKDRESDGNAPVKVGPEEDKQVGEVDATREPLPEAWPYDHHRQCDQQKGTRHKGQTHGQGARFPEWAVIFNLIRDVQCLNCRCEAARGRPNRAQDSEREEGSLVGRYH